MQLLHVGKFFFDFQKKGNKHSPGCGRSEWLGIWLQFYDIVRSVNESSEQFWKLCFVIFVYLYGINLLNKLE